MAMGAAMTTETFDAVVIGAGQSGPFLAAKLAEAGRRTALVERRRLGGTCVNDGCIPTKTLVASARAAWVVANASRWGVSVPGGVRVEMKAVKARKDMVVQASLDALQGWLEKLPNLTMVDGHARFVDAHTVEVAGPAGARRMRADQFFLNTGARAVVPDLPGIADVPILTNVGMMDIDETPEHLVVLGGSYIALEFGQMYRRFGSRVTVLERGPQLISRDDEDVAAAVAEVLRGEGVDVRLGARIERLEAHAGGVRVHVGGDVVDGSHFLVATGRRPNSDDLGLDAAGVKRDARGYIEVDDELRTSQPHVYALGDVNGRGAFTHTSYNDFEIVEANLLRGGRRRVSDRIPIYGLFVDPPLGRVGMSEREARKSGKRVLVGLRPMTRVGRAFERGETYGFIKILVDADSQRILGAAILGVEGDEVVHAIADVMYSDRPYTVLRDAVHTHPTVSELLPTVLEELRPLDG
jgi:pyruvate/2-oxoglutarate dehydrogenase complex dihydrolipoamide dehydrogenase (E3) component